MQQETECVHQVYDLERETTMCNQPVCAGIMAALATPGVIPPTESIGRGNDVRLVVKGKNKKFRLPMGADLIAPVTDWKPSYLNHGWEIQCNFPLNCKSRKTS